jgi:hypothetical protein
LAAAAALKSAAAAVAAAGGMPQQGYQPQQGHPPQQGMPGRAPAIPQPGASAVDRPDVVDYDDFDEEGEAALDEVLGNGPTAKKSKPEPKLTSAAPPVGYQQPGSGQGGMPGQGMPLKAGSPRAQVAQAWNARFTELPSRTPTTMPPPRGPLQPTQAQTRPLSQQPSQTPPTSRTSTPLPPVAAGSSAVACLLVAAGNPAAACLLVALLRRETLLRHASLLRRETLLRHASLLRRETLLRHASLLRRVALLRRETLLRHASLLRRETLLWHASLLRRVALLRHASLLRGVALLRWRTEANASPLSVSSVVTQREWDPVLVAVSQKRMNLLGVPLGSSINVARMASRHREWLAIAVVAFYAHELITPRGVTARKDKHTAILRDGIISDGFAPLWGERDPLSSDKRSLGRYRIIIIIIISIDKPAQVGTRCHLARSCVCVQATGSAKRTKGRRDAQHDAKKGCQRNYQSNTSKFAAIIVFSHCNSIRAVERVCALNTADSV